MKNSVTESLGISMLLALSGGFMDAYTYLVRGKVFATGQTGNFVLVAIRGVSGEYEYMMQSCVPIVAFWLGIFFVKYISKKIENRKYVYWKTVVLWVSILLLYIAGWIPDTVPDLFVNTIISFTAAVWFGTFRSFETNTAYAPVFCTGNMRSCAEFYYEGLICKNKLCLKKAGKYTGILCSFFLGAILSGKLSLRYGVKAIWAVCFVLGCAWFILVCEKNSSDSQEWKKNGENKTYYI